MIKILENVLEKSECDVLIDIASKIDQMQKMDTLGDKIDGYRTANGCWIRENNEVTDKIKYIVSKNSGVSIKHQEDIHIVRYDIGGEYKPHHDFFHPNTDYYESACGKSGQRTHSFLFYLNDVIKGGDTEFTQMKIRVSAKTGRLLIWDNIDIYGNIDSSSLHAGLPVEEGEKWIAIVWVREKQFN